MFESLKKAFDTHNSYWDCSICGKEVHPNKERYHLTFDDLCDSVWHDRCAANSKILDNFMMKKNGLSADYIEKYWHKDTTLKGDETCCYIHPKARCQFCKHPFQEYAVEMIKNGSFHPDGSPEGDKLSLFGIVKVRIVVGQFLMHDCCYHVAQQVDDPHTLYLGAVNTEKPCPTHGAFVRTEEPRSESHQAD